METDFDGCDFQYRCLGLNFDNNNNIIIKFFIIIFINVLLS